MSETLQHELSSPKFTPFSITQTSYKTLPNAQELPVWVRIPKGVHTGPRPLIIHFHGGFLVTGHAMFAEWAAQWSLDYAVLHSAILISPNYRLMPESNGLDILSDLKDFWTWVENDLPAFLKRVGSDVTPDYGRVLVYGESAGGYLALQSGMMKRGLVKAVVAAYPMTYVDSPWYSVASETKRPFGAPQVPRAILDQHISKMEKGKVVTGAFPMDRMQLALVLVQHGLWTQTFGEDESLFPVKVMGMMQKGEKVPFLLAMHGTDDTAVPCEETRRFVKEWKEKFGEERATGVFESGDHGFDGEATLETEWLKDGLKEVTKQWLE